MDDISGQGYLAPALPPYRAQIIEYRATRGRQHPLLAHVLPVCPAIRCGARPQSAIAAGGKHHGRSWLRRLSFVAGRTPSRPTLCRLFQRMLHKTVEAAPGSDGAPAGGAGPRRQDPAWPQGARCHGGPPPERVQPPPRGWPSGKRASPARPTGSGRAAAGTPARAPRRSVEKQVHAIPRCRLRRCPTDGARQSRPRAMAPPATRPSAPSAASAPPGSPPRPRHHAPSSTSSGHNLTLHIDPETGE